MSGWRDVGGAVALALKIQKHRDLYVLSGGNRPRPVSSYAEHYRLLHSQQPVDLSDHPLSYWLGASG